VTENDTGFVPVRSEFLMSFVIAITAKRHRVIDDSVGTTRLPGAHFSLGAVARTLHKCQFTLLEWHWELYLHFSDSDLWM
jgi:hypothetical protein